MDVKYIFVLRILRLMAGLLCDLAYEWCQNNPRCKSLYDRAVLIIDEMNKEEQK